eukprot:5985144-Lingulodinium_polyedra.AAC.1
MARLRRPRAWGCDGTLPPGRWRTGLPLGPGGRAGASWSSPLRCGSRTLRSSSLRPWGDRAQADAGPDPSSC